MAKATLGNTITRGICEALGLKNVVNLDIKMHLGEVVTITVDYYPESEDLQKIIPALTHAKYKLISIEEEPEIIEITAAGESKKYIAVNREGICR